MASKKISALPDGGALQDADEFPAARGTGNVHITGANLKAHADSAVAAEAAARAAADALLVPLSQKGVANGVATLGADGFVPAAQIGGSIPQLSVDPRMRWLGLSLKRMLSDGTLSFGVGVLGDSTGALTTRWPYLLATEIGEELASAWTVKYLIWDDTSQLYDAPTTIQLGAAGERYVQFVTASSQALKQDQSLVGAMPATIDIAVKVELDDWTPTTDQTLVAHYGASGSRGFRFVLSSAVSGKPTFIYTTDGSTDVTKQCSAAPVVSDGGTLWLRVTFVSNDGSGNNVTTFYTSSDGVSWTQLGNVITTAGTVTVFDPASTPWEIGGRGQNGAVMQGKLYEVKIRNGLNGKLIAPVMPEHWTRYSASSPTPSGAPVLWLVNGSKVGADITYLSDSTRLPKLLGLYGLRAVLMSCSHNDAYKIDAAYLSSWTSWVSAVKTRAPDAVPAMVLQNPEVSPASYVNEQAIRRQLLGALAQQLDMPTVDVFQAFEDTGDVAGYLNSDGIHPSDALGSPLWRDTTYAALFG